MALINCPECNKEISEKALSCPHCGNPMNVVQSPIQPTIETPAKTEEFLCCPKCRSKNLHSEKKGFSGGQALAGAVLTGGIGILAGTIGSKNVDITCLKCGNKFKAGEAIIVKSTDDAELLDRKILRHLRKGESAQAYRLYQNETHASVRDTNLHIAKLASKNNIKTPKHGCLVMIVLFIGIASLLTSIVFNN